jgi:cyclopropane fatty-acyl-phospholipid synthase-like methyltransferase
LQLPTRYSGGPHDAYIDECLNYMKPGATVLDVGAGRRPVLPFEQIRDTYYVALDLDADELEAAPEGLYKESVAAPIETFQPQLVGRFDLVASFYVFEHVRSLETAIENCRLYLKPGGTMVTQFSGRFSYFAVANQVIPHVVTRKLGRVLAGREPHTIFPAFYNNCWYGAVEKVMRNWSEVDIRPVYTGGGYLLRKPFDKVMPAYLAYEDWTERRSHRNLAAHYMVVAKK